MSLEAQQSLLRWFDDNARDLPWRAVDDPYAILVCEVMSQQTRIETVRRYWTRWMAEFPTVESLAEAEEGDVMKMWAGLGYYRRARSLHACARAVVDQHGGQLPGTASILATLPGIGPYTSAAVASIAFGEAIAAVDGNVSRVVARLLANDSVQGTAEFRRAVAEAAAALIDSSRPGDSNEALMELGATICTPRNPLCDLCPLMAGCLGYAGGDPSVYPTPKARKVPQPQRSCAVVAVRGQSVFLRLGERELLRGLWEFPTYDGHEDAVSAISDEHGLYGDVTAAGEVVWMFSHIRMTYEVVELRVHPHVEGRGGKWVDLDTLSELGISSAMRAVASIAPCISPDPM